MKKVGNIGLVNGTNRPLAFTSPLVMERSQVISNNEASTQITIRPSRLWPQDVRSP